MFPTQLILTKVTDSLEETSLTRKQQRVSGEEITSFGAIAARRYMILSFKLICESQCIYSSYQVSKESFLLLLSKITLLVWKGGAKTCPFLNVPHIFILFFDTSFRSICSFQIECWPLFLPPLPKIMFLITMAIQDITTCELTLKQEYLLCFCRTLCLCYSCPYS